MTDSPEGVSSYVSMFADDVKLIKNVKTKEDCRKLQNDLNKVHEWANKWLLKFNPSRCKIMKMGKGERRTKRHLHHKGEGNHRNHKERNIWEWI